MLPAVLTGLGYEKLRHFQIIHITGRRDYSEVERRYREYSADCRVYPFFEDMSALYSCSDLIVSRAGAATLAEISYYGKPAILIPYKHAKGHQIENSEIFLEKKAAIVIDEDKADRDFLRNVINNVTEDKNLMKSLCEHVRSVNPENAAARLAGEIKSIHEKS
jgi:UDP-N-acetylglucosamine--N-acetylmuramyl-(pentapeptide) pyrophosphoryl-undecaprenol N-acetylglucosamine transferase